MGNQLHSASFDLASRRMRDRSINIILFINMGPKSEGAQPPQYQKWGAIAPPAPPLPTPMQLTYRLEKPKMR